MLQEWLGMPHVSGNTELDIALKNGDSSEFTDPEFPPTPQSLFMDPEHPPASAPAGADWSRVHGHLYVPDKKLVSILPVRHHCTYFDVREIFHLTEVSECTICAAGCTS